MQMKVPASALRGPGLLALFMGVCLAAFVPHAGALPDYLEVAKKTYGIKPKSALGKASCKLCHTADGPPELNPYGSSVKLALKQKKTDTLTPAILHSLDKKDADNDGFPNGLEIKSDTLPGDPKSHPDGPPPPAPDPKATAPVTYNQLIPRVKRKHHRQPGPNHIANLNQSVKGRFPGYLGLV